MYRNKKDVDKHVDSLMFKLSPKDFNTRAYSIARLYFEVGDYGSCQRYVEQYLTQKSNNAAAHKLLGQAFQKLGQKEKAIEQFKISLDIDPTQTSTILDVCALLAEDDVTIDLGRAKYWCEKAEAMFPKHPVTFNLREKLLTVANPNPEALVKLLKSELESRPKDAVLHARLVKHLLHNNNIKQAYEHSCNIEFDKRFFSNYYEWYISLSEILKYNPLSTNDWLYQLLLLTVKERLCVLSLTELTSLFTTNSTSKSVVESSELLHDYDQAIESVAKTGAPSGSCEFHSSLLQHHRGQLAFHIATYLLKKAKKGQLNWRDAKEWSAPLMFIAWQTIPLDSKVNWLVHAHEKQQNAVRRWYFEGSYRCSQSGHFLLANMQDKSQVILDQISQFCSGNQWKDKIYENIFPAPEQLVKKKSSHLMSLKYNVPTLRLPRKAEVQAYDDDAQREYPNSLHHFVWMLLNYKNYAEFKCTLFDMLKVSTITNCGPETLNKMDILAFLFSATLTAQKLREKTNYISTDRPDLLPANITDLLCSLPQIKWWDCAYKFSQNELGVEYTDIRTTLSRGIEVMRCIDNHGLDPELLCTLGQIFITISKKSNNPEEKSNLEIRAQLYYSSAIPLLEKLKSNFVLKLPEKRMFDYTHKQLSTKEINRLLDDSKLQIALSQLNEGEYEKVINLLSNVKSPQAYYYLSETYKKIALEESNLSKDTGDNYASLLSKAKHFAYKALEKMKHSDDPKSNSLYSDIQTLIEDIESRLNRCDIDLSENIVNDISSDEYASVNETGILPSRPKPYQSVSSTPKQTRHNVNATAYRTAIDMQTFESAKVDQLFLEKIEKQMNNLQKTEATITDFMEQTRNWFDDNRKLSNNIISKINSQIEYTADQFKVLKISVDQVKEQMEECRNESKDVADLKKQIAELKKEVNKLKKPSTVQGVDESDLYNLEDDYRTNDNTTFTAQLPFQAPQVVPPFAQRLMPPFSMPSNPYQLYGQNFYNLYNQYSQFAQPPTVPGAPHIFDPTRTPMNYPGVYPTPDQMYLDVAHLVPPTVPTMPTVSTTQNIVNVCTIPSTSITTKTTAVSTPKVALDSKEIPKSLPVNVVITSSDPLPTCTTTPAPVLSVTIPQKHIKGSPHNYQIPLPSSNDCKTVPPPVFNFPSSNKPNVTTSSSVLSWSPKFLSSQAESTLSIPSGNIFKNSDTSENVDGMFTGFSPNTSANKSRTLSEKSNTSIENYDPCPDFKPIIPLPAEVKITTGEEDETIIFSSRAKLFRFVDKQWKERGIGEMKLLKHKITGKVRVLMRREQVHKICANHIISPKMEIKPMTNETKAYCWVAHDYAEETVILEKFCIRFKTAELGKEFYETFEKARKESADVTVTDKNNSNAKPVFEVSTSKVNLTVKQTITDSQPGKPVVGGFTFSSTPSFKAITETNENETKVVEASKNKINVFSGLTFNTGTSFTFGNNFNLASTVNNQVTKTPDKADSTPLNTSDVVEEFEPTVEFKPVVPLPALVNQKTGEEDEIILFEHRAKLLRFDAGEKEWKERGLGNIKLLVHKDNNKKVRLLMRREQIMKVCCNHTVTKEMTFQKMPNMDKAVTWCAKDFSEGELVSETFCLRFKTTQICDDFIEAVKAAQIKIGDDAKAAKEEQNAAKYNNQLGFGDKFKPKPGSWFCETCYTNNLESFVKCACCETPNRQQKNNSIEPSATTTSISSWGDKFKPKPGSWECKQCLIRNEAELDQCSACNSLKDGAVKKTDVKFNDVPKFNFGIPSSATQKENPTSTNPVILKTPEPSIFGANNVQKFTFGIPKSETPNFGITTKATTPSVFGVTTLSSEAASPINYSVKKNETESVTVTPVKTPLLQTPNTNITSFGKTSGTYTFSFKASTEGKSPVKSPRENKGEDSDGNEYTSEDEGHHIHFSPVIPMPDKIEVVTGEENEEELYSHRAKLFIFNKEWKERGLGNVKILKHKETGNLRVLMRRDQIHKICLNHTLVPEITYKPKDDKTWLFYANDFSDGEVVLQHFCLRFKNNEIALQFKDAIDKALAGRKKSSGSKNQLPSKDADNEDVVFVSEIQASCEEKQMAKELMLPEHFFTYKNKDPCPGCRGCSEDDNSKPETDKVLNKKLISTSSENPTSATPLKNSPIVFLSPTSSVYGTPNNFDKSSNTTMFRTPLSAIKSNTTQAAALSTSSLSFAEADSTDKENTLTDSPNKSINNTQPVPFASGGVMQTQVAATKATILAAPKLSVSQSSNDYSTGAKSGPEANLAVHSDENKSLFGENRSVFAENKTVFGENKTAFGDNKSIFGEKKPVFGENKSVFGENKSVFGENKSVFGENKSVFGENKSVFGDNKSVFGENKSVFGDNKSAFGENKSVFGENKSVFGDNKSVFGENKSVFGENKSVFSENKSGNTGPSKSVFSFNPESNKGNSQPTSLFTDTNFSQVNFFSNNSQEGIFGPTALKNTQSKPLFGTGTFSFGKLTDQNQDQAKTIFAAAAADKKNSESASKDIESIQQNGNNAKNIPEKPVVTNQKSESPTDEINKTIEPDVKTDSANDTLFKVDNSLTFEALLSSAPVIQIEKKPDFKWEGAGQQLFANTSAIESNNKSKNDSGAADDSVAAVGADEEYDPHYEPIVPMPEKIIVTTGEEDEQKIFGERCKLYRFDDQSRDWKERGVGEMKILYHPQRKSYRFLLRREQVHKAVLNMLLYMDINLLPLKNSTSAWTWAGQNYAEGEGEQETLAARFKTAAIATLFYDKVNECVRKLQASAAEAIRNQKEGREVKFESIAPLRLPKHLDEGARADGAVVSATHSAVVPQPDTPASTLNTDKKENGDVQKPSESGEAKQVHFEEPEEDQDYDEEDYENTEGYEHYYGDEEEEDSSVYYPCKAVVRHDAAQETYEQTHVQVSFDHDICSPKILVTDYNTGEIIADMLIHTDTEFQLSGDTCSWSGTDYPSNVSVEKTITITFPDSDSALEFYDSCETSKAATYASTDPES